MKFRIKILLKVRENHGILGQGIYGNPENEREYLHFKTSLLD